MNIRVNYFTVVHFPNVHSVCVHSSNMPTRWYMFNVAGSTIRYVQESLRPLPMLMTFVCVYFAFFFLFLALHSFTRSLAGMVVVIFAHHGYAFTQQQQFSLNFILNLVFCVCCSCKSRCACTSIKFVCLHTTFYACSLC